MSVCVSAENSQAVLPRLDSVEPIQIQVAKTSADIAEFVAFPKQLLRKNPFWISPLDLEVKRFISPSHPFRLHGDAEVFLARKKGRVVGRMIASDDPRYNAEHGSNVGCFGMFHCIDDQRVANSLLDAGARWLQNRGRTRIMGPIDYSTNYAAGLLIDGFNSPARVMMNYHPRYYARLLENWGLHKAKDLYAWWFTRSNCIDDVWRTRVDRLAKRSGVVIRPIRLNDFDAEIKRCHRLYNEAWQDNWSFVKMTSEEFYGFARELKKIATPEMILIAEVEGKPVGMAMTLPDLNEAIAPLDGRLTTYGIPIGLARLLYRLRKVKTVRLAALGITPGYRRRGIAEMLIQKTFDYGKDVLGYTGAELSWTLEDNDMINRAISRVGGSRYKTYRVYERSIELA